MRPRLDFAAEIRLAARAGFLTKDIWEEFFAKGKLRWRQYKWQYLSSRGYFRKHSAAYVGETLVLNPRNSTVRQLTGGFVETPPYVAELYHDQAVLKGVMRLAKGGLIKRFVLEKQLERENGLDRDAIKYPDAILVMPSGDRVALEIEVMRKSFSRYLEIFKRYRKLKDISKIVYVCEEGSLMELIKRAAEKSGATPENLGFGSLSVWLNRTVDMQIQFRNRKVSFKNL